MIDKVILLYIISYNSGLSLSITLNKIESRISTFNKGLKELFDLY